MTVFRFALVPILFGLLMVLVALTPSATLTAASTLFVGVAMIAIASFAGL